MVGLIFFPLCLDLFAPLRPCPIPDILCSPFPLLYPVLTQIKQTETTQMCDHSVKQVYYFYPFHR